MQSVISFLLQTEIIPLCLRTMEMGTELSRTVATFIVQKILTDELGLTYICATPERFFAVGAVLTGMVESISTNPSPRLLKHILRCAPCAMPCSCLKCNPCHRNVVHSRATSTQLSGCSRSACSEDAAGQVVNSRGTTSGALLETTTVLPPAFGKKSL
jgi:hypothetical protein